MASSNRRLTDRTRTPRGRTPRTPTARLASEFDPSITRSVLDTDDSDIRFRSNIFRQDVNVAPTELVSGIASNLEPLVVEPLGDLKPGGLRAGFQLPELPSLDLGGEESAQEEEAEDDEVNASNNPINFDFGIEIPTIDFSGPNVNFTPALDAVNKILPNVNVGLDIGGIDLGDIEGEVTDYITNFTSIKFEDIPIVDGDGTQYGLVGIGNTGKALDLTTEFDKTLDAFTKDTPLEGVKGVDLYEAINNPQAFINKVGREEGAKWLANFTDTDAGTASDIVLALSNPQEFLETKGEEKATEFVLNTLNLDKSLSKNNVVVSGISELIRTGDIGKAVEAGAKAYVTESIVNTVGSAIDAIVPGLGSVIKVIAKVFDYSCYLSTSAYYHGFINKADYLAVTRYRIHNQSKELFSGAVWLGYRSFFKSRYQTLIDNSKYAQRMYNFVTKPYIRHIQYINGEKPFNLRGWLTAQALKSVCIVSHVLNGFNRNMNKNVDILKVYRNIIKVVENGCRK